MTEQMNASDEFDFARTFWIGPSGRPRSVIVADDHYAVAVDRDDACHRRQDFSVSRSVNSVEKPPVLPDGEDVLIAYSPSVVLERPHSDRHID